MKITVDINVNVTFYVRVLDGGGILLTWDKGHFTRVTIVGTWNGAVRYRIQFA